MKQICVKIWSFDILCTKTNKCNSFKFLILTLALFLIAYYVYSACCNCTRKQIIYVIL